jgi:hypothetical protein
MDAPGEKLPTSAFVVIAMWAAVETFFIIVSEGDDRRPDDTFRMVVLPMLQGGVLSALSMVVSWFVFGNVATDKDLSVTVVRRRWFSVVILSLSITLVAALALSCRGVGNQSQDLIAGVVMLTAGATVPSMLIRDYFGFRMVLRHRQEPVVSQVEVSIRRLLVMTAVLASLLGTCRLLIGGLNTELVVLGLAGFVLGLNWCSTAIWLLGQRRYIVVTFVFFAISQLLGVAFSRPEPIGGGDALSASIWRVWGVQLHQILFLAVMRAGQFRFIRLRKRPLRRANEVAGAI